MHIQYQNKYYQQQMELVDGIDMVLTLQNSLGLYVEIFKQILTKILKNIQKIQWIQQIYLIIKLEKQVVQLQQWAQYQKINLKLICLIQEIVVIYFQEQQLMKIMQKPYKQLTNLRNNNILLISLFNYLIQVIKLWDKILTQLNMHKILPMKYNKMTYQQQQVMVCLIICIQNKYKKQYKRKWLNIEQETLKKMQKKQWKNQLKCQLMKLIIFHQNQIIQVLFIQELYNKMLILGISNQWVENKMIQLLQRPKFSQLIRIKIPKIINKNYDYYQYLNNFLYIFQYTILLTIINQYTIIFFKIYYIIYIKIVYKIINILKSNFINLAFIMVSFSQGIVNIFQLQFLKFQFFYFIIFICNIINQFIRFLIISHYLNCIIYLNFFYFIIIFN